MWVDPTFATDRCHHGLVRLFHRSSPPAPRDDVRSDVSSVAVVVEGADTPAERRARLRRAVAEAVILQDRAVDVLADIRAREPLADMARRGGPLARRFLALRRELPPPVDADMARQCETAARVLDHHGTVLIFALELLASDWRSPAIVSQLERLDGLGEPAERLDALYTELTH